MPKTVRIHFESTDGEQGVSNNDWRYSSFQLIGMDHVLEDITKNARVRVRVESFVWSNRSIGLPLAYVVHLDNASFVDCYRTRDNFNAPTIIHVGNGPSYYRSGPGSNEYVVDTHWLRMRTAKINIRRIDGDEHDDVAYSTEANVADWFMTLAIEYE